MKTKKTVARKFALVGILSLMMSGQVVADIEPEAAPDWICSNPEVEISCDERGCLVSDSHTPMSVALSRQEISVCAYSGCWQGAPDAVLRTGERFQTFTAESLPFSTAPETKADIAITVDRESGVATLLVADIFAHPMRCQKSTD
ncbi:MAG: hypothetical protein AAFR82_07755 [Pseudomonadota bacterium]